jgi:transcriptional regulator with XRE-family HTH domain
MSKKSDRERTPFGLRMLEARNAAGLTQKQVRDALGIAQSTLSELETEAHSSGYTSQLAALYKVDAHVLATGEAAPQMQVGENLAQYVSQPRPIMSLPRVTWEELMGANLNQPFELEVMDGAFGADFPPGCVMRLDPQRSVRPGWPLLVKDGAGRYYLRDYQADVGGRWQAVARARGFQPLDSIDHGLQVVAVMKGVDWP